MGPRLSESVARRKVVSSARSFRICSCITRSTSGLSRTHPDLPWCRYADDGLVHCRTEQEAEALKLELQARLAECQLEMHPTKTKIVYCQDGKRKGKYPNTKFDFLGYCFRPRLTSARNGMLFWGFNPA